MENSNDTQNERSEITDISGRSSYSSVLGDDKCDTTTIKNLVIAISNNKFEKKKSLNSLTKLPLTPGLCRICLQPDSEYINKCISPCLCYGSMSKVHKSCLEKWLAYSNSDSCEICFYQFEIKRVATYSLLGSIKEWFNDSETEDEANEFLYEACYFIIITPILTLVTCAGVLINGIIFDETREPAYYDSSTNRFLSFVSLSLILTGNFIYGCWASIRLQHHFNQWYDFYKRCRQVILLEKPYTN
ncbi:E3 ubiquitin-protein ligase MARCHF2-like [Daktulosphaira vitifoliae]|uniref:E3 ubiquitin-protein ligase MARCHF2-like n=1 Tax=Daktulosphaira vitifoliae TaxID=58002 RepID=UPI0021A9AD7A|nr:E3 ubiquitin-protein ligase MARCHF2-like [Daktulosphaira vitifoliae]